MRKLSFILLFISLFVSIQQSRASGGNKHIDPINRELNQTLDKTAIKGKVTDASGEPVIGAVVQEKGKNNGTTTDVDGNFAINVSTNAVLQISLIGYVTAEVTVKNSKELSIVLDENTSQLEEVVVVGYGIQRKVNLSGAVDRVNTRDLEARPITNVSRGLQGLIPNLNIDFASGEPGKAANINIRGTSSINPTSPLILIDGVPSDAEEMGRLLPDDIESISVLKDAASAAIYGARAAFGVILITTKQGTSDRIQVSYNNIFAWKRPSVLPQRTADPYIYLRLKNIAVLNTPWSSGHVSSDELLEWARQRSDNPAGTDPVRLDPTNEKEWQYMGNTDWTKHFLDKLTFSNSHQVSVSGASNKATYYLSGGYDNENGILSNVVKNDNFVRYSLRSKISYKIRDWFSLTNNTSFVSTKRIKPSYYTGMGMFYNIAPTDYYTNPDGTWANNSLGNTLASLKDGGEETTDYNRTQSIFTAEMRFLKDALKLTGNFSFTKGGEDYRWFQTKYLIGYGPGDVREEGNTSRAYNRRTAENYTQLEVFANYNKNIGKHYIAGVLGFSQEYSSWNRFYADRRELISSSFPSIALATGDQYVDEEFKDWALRGAFYRANYIYDNRYILEFNGRYDGSSRFPKDKRYGFFPSASAAWRVDGESFFEDVRSAVSQLKLRASYGSLGNQLTSEYGYISTMSAQNANYIIDGKIPLAITAPTLVSENYTWETVNTKNIGIDLGFVDNKLNVGFDLFRRDTKDMLAKGKELPSVLGTSAPRENAADMKTTGWELAVGYNDQFKLADKALSFGVRFMLSDSRSWITRFDNPNKRLGDYYIGQEIGEIWGLQNDGFFENADQISKLDQSQIVPWGSLEIVNGWPRYKDLDGDKKITKGGLTVDDAGDLSVIGNTSPRYRFGLNVNAEWNGFDFMGLLQGIGKRDYYPLSYLYWGFYQQPYAGGVEHIFDFYRGSSDSDTDRQKHSQAYLNAGLAEQNLNARYPVLQSWLADKNLGTSIGDAKGLAIPQTEYLLNGAYLRIQNITIGYTLPTNLTKKLGLQKLRFYASGDNIYEWSALKKYFDPEAITDGGQFGYVYPFNRQYSFGLNIIF